MKEPSIEGGTFGISYRFTSANDTEWIEQGDFEVLSPDLGYMARDSYLSQFKDRLNRTHLIFGETRK